MLVIRSNPLASHGSVAPLKHPGVQVHVIHKSRIGELLSACSGCPPRGSSWCVRVQSEAAPVALISFTVTRAAPAPAPCSSTEGTVGGEGLHQDPHTQNHSDICELAQRQRKYGVDRNSKSLFSHQQKTPHF